MGKLKAFIASALFTKIMLAVTSLGVYCWLFTPQFAVILIAALLFHEYGHLRAMHACGIPTKGIFLIPFFGGMVISERDFTSRGDESYSAMMGPAWGLGTAVIPALTCLIYPHPALAAIASVIALINLFNMLPINPLDGGRVIKSIAFSIDSRLGLAVLMGGMLAIFAGLIFLNIGLGLFLIISAIAYIELAAEWFRLKRHNLHGAKSKMSPAQIGLHLGGYFGLLLSLLVVIQLTAEVSGAKIALKMLVEGN